jgi:hypothetical protein
MGDAMRLLATALKTGSQPPELTLVALLLPIYQGIAKCTGTGQAEALGLEHKRRSRDVARVVAHNTGLLRHSEVHSQVSYSYARMVDFQGRDYAPFPACSVSKKSIWL